MEICEKCTGQKKNSNSSVDTLCSRRWSIIAHALSACCMEGLDCKKCSVEEGGLVKGWVILHGDLTNTTSARWSGSTLIVT